MNTRRFPHPRAFTLIELLVVVTIVAILASLAATQISNSINEANRLKVRTVVMELKNGIDQYQLDYNRFPIDSNIAGANGEDAPELMTDGSNSLVDVLMGIPPATGSGSADLNPRRTPYCQFPPAKNERYGLVGSARPYRLNDMWGQPYHILLDTNSDNQVKNPDAANTDPKVSQNPPSHLVTRAAVYSAGKDAAPRTGDDVTSWRPK